MLNLYILNLRNHFSLCIFLTLKLSWTYLSYFWGNYTQFLVVFGGSFTNYWWLSLASMQHHHLDQTDGLTDGRREGRMNRKPSLKRLCDTKWCVVMIWNQNFLWGYKMLCDFRFHWNEELYPSQVMYWCMSVSLSVCMANFLLYWKLSVLFSFFHRFLAVVVVWLFFLAQ